jgi:hypothetical protein
MFYGFEGCRGSSTGSCCESGGCCPLNCTHVWNYEQALSRIFPSLARKMREVDLVHQMGEDGRIPHRTALPLYLKRWHDDDPTSHVYAADGHCGAILKSYREYRAGGGKEFLDRHWPALKKALEYAQMTWDADGDGVFDGPQWNTYDCHLHGHNSFVTGLYLAALGAMERMAALQGEEELAGQCRDRLQQGASLIESELWNGEYYVQVYDREKHKSMQYGTGCHSDQLLGQWWAHVLDLGHILTPEHLRTALNSIYTYNFMRSMKGHKQQPRVYLKDDEAGLLICTWPKGGRPDPVTLYCDEVWTGIEYPLAGLMFYEGMVDEGISIVEAARTRHDGRFRSPWNEVECGDHYARPMSSWSMLDALLGYAYDGAGAIRFGPGWEEKDFRCFFAAGDAWGSYSQDLLGADQVCRISVHSGTLRLSRITVPRKRTGRVVLTLGETVLEEPTTSVEGEELVVEVDLDIPPGNELSIVVEGSG